MTIDNSAIHAALIRALPDPEKSGARLRASSEARQSRYETGPVNQAGALPSTIVSISDAARIAAQGSKNSEPKQSSAENNSPEGTTRLDRKSESYLQQLEADILSARRTIGISAAEFKEARSSDANSDLLLRAIEDAAKRAGLVLGREIAHHYDGADQTTFQARGVLRTAHS
jgi:hypothetical protein